MGISGVDAVGDAVPHFGLIKVAKAQLCGADVP